jgi:hypothetical protein
MCQQAKNHIYGHRLSNSLCFSEIMPFPRFLNAKAYSL